MKVIRTNNESNGSIWRCNHCAHDSRETPSSVQMFDIEHAQNMEPERYLPEDEIYGYMCEVWTGECGCMSEDEYDWEEIESGEWMCGECESQYEDKDEAVECCSSDRKFADA